MINFIKYVDRNDMQGLDKAIKKQIEKEFNNNPLSKPYIDKVKEIENTINNLKLTLKDS